MGKFFFLQSFYAITGIAFFVHDLFAKLPMGPSMLNAFIWPYAQWPLIKAQGLHLLQPVLQLMN